tara:strand:+ start:1564 stop:1707 length:144 start_codon:yes stop_codon:yes gene_type:complete
MIGYVNIKGVDYKIATNKVITVKYEGDKNAKGRKEKIQVHKKRNEGS